MASKPKIVVLRRRSDFEKLRVEGKKVRVSTWLTLIYLKGSSELRFGWIVPKKVGNAVLRNKVKRWCREIVRKLDFESMTADVAILVSPRTPNFFDSIKFSEFEETLSRGLQSVSERLVR